MITFPYYIFLVIYLFFLLGWSVFFLIDLAHLRHTGNLDTTSLIVTVGILVFAVAILGAAWGALQGVDWSGSFPLFDANDLGRLFSPSTSQLTQFPQLTR